MTAPVTTPSQASYDAAVSLIRAQTVAYASAVWGAGSMSDAMSVQLIGLVAPAVEAAQLQIANLTSVYLASRTGSSPLPVDPKIVMARGVPNEVVYQRPVVTARTLVSRGKSATQALNAGGRRLASLAATDLQMAKVRQADKSLASAGVTQYRRVLKGTANCALCVIASSQAYNVGTLAPIHPGCVPGDALVLPPSSGVDAFTRRKFEGELVEFVTAAGDKVRVTPNHPVLTDKGWLPADLLCVGDTVFRRSNSHGVVGGGPDVHNRPARVEDLFDAARVSFPLVRMPLASEDFHGDGAEGEVDVVYVNRNLASPGRSQLVQVPGELCLMHAHGGGLALDGGGPLGAFGAGSFPAPGGLVRGGGLGSDLFSGHLGGAELSSLRSAARFDAPADKFSFESASVYAGKGLDLKRRLAGEVEADSVVEFRRVGFSGHVFNLQTSEGWYSAGNHIVSNCDCGVDVIPPGTDLDDVLDTNMLNTTHAQVGEFTGVEDRGGRAVDYRKLIVTKDHGEIGPLVAWDGQHFTGPASIPGPAPARPSVFESAPVDLDDFVRGPNSPSFVQPSSDGPSVDDLLASIVDV